MNVCFVTSEVVPYAKTGGLGDVSRALPVALAGAGCNVKVFVPLYQSINTIHHDLTFARDLYEIPVDVGDTTVVFNVWYGKMDAAEIYFVDCPHYYHRSAVYTNDADEDERFILLQKAAFAIMQRYNWAPDVVQGNDWPTGLMPAMLRKSYGWDDLFRGAASVMGIHNVGYHGSFGPSSVYKAGLSYDDYYPGGPLEFSGAFSFLKAGIVFADVICTVSPTYAREIQTPQLGLGMDGVLRARAGDLVGILNGIDTTVWDPSTDSHIDTNYDAATLDKKRNNKIALLRECGLPHIDGVPVIGLISRLVEQKGMSLLHAALGPLLESRPVQLVVLGSGSDNDENLFRRAASVFPDRVYARIGFDEGFAHRIEAGADMFLMPSLYEPCGLNQMYSLRYGTVPIVRNTGGLADTVVDQDESRGFGTGFSFHDYSPIALLSSVDRALACYSQPDVWRGIQERGMARDFSWNASAAEYIRLYEYAVRRHRS